MAHTDEKHVLDKLVDDDTHGIMKNHGMLSQDRGRDPDEDWAYDIRNPAILRDAVFDPSARLLICAGEVSGYVLLWRPHYLTISHMFGDSVKLDKGFRSRFYRPR